jgi:hypothetical protein
MFRMTQRGESPPSLKRNVDSFDEIFLNNQEALSKYGKTVKKDLNNSMHLRERAH